MMNHTVQLTPLEQLVFDALKQNADDVSGGDFAMAEEVNTKNLGITRQQFGALLTTLQTKGVINVDITYVNNQERVTQVTFN